MTPTAPGWPSKKLVTQDEVFAIVSPLGTPTNLAVMDYLLEQQIPVISPHSGAVDLVDAAQAHLLCAPAFLPGRGPAAGAVRAGRAHAQARRHLCRRRPVRPGGLDGVRAKSWRAAGLEPVVTVTHSAGESAPAGGWPALAACQPDLVLLYTYVKPAADLLARGPCRRLPPGLAGQLCHLRAGPVPAGRRRGDARPAGDQLPGRAARPPRRDAVPPADGPRATADETPGTHSRIGYAAAQLVVEGLQRAGPDLTREGFIAALEGLQDWTGGLLPPISYSATDHRGLTALAMMRAVHGRWVCEKGLLRLKE